MASTVAIVRCDTYDADEVRSAVARGLELLGGVHGFVLREREQILLKPNLLTGASPEDCVTTHPAVFEAVARQMRDAGADLTYGDSPGFGRTEGVARKAGLVDVAERLEIPVADFTGGRQISFPDGALIKQWYLANGALDADGIVSLSKMKTHALTRITGAVKNMFGCVPGMRKGEFHARMREAERFSQMLVDLSSALPARLHVMDGVVAMEGNGPRSGEPRRMGVLLLSRDPVAVDATFARMIDLDVELVGTCVFGEESGLGTCREVEILGDSFEEFVTPDFDVNRVPGSTTGGSTVSRFMRTFVIPKPVIAKERCTACGTCVKVCPVEPKAVRWTSPGASEAKQPPEHDYDLCIRCYCCQELCPERAIDVEVPTLGRFIHR